MKRWAIVLGVVVLLLAGASVVALPVVEARVADQIRARIEQDGVAKVGAVEVGILRRGIVLRDVSVARYGASGGTLTFASLDASGLSWPLSELLAGRTPFTGWQWGDPAAAERIEVIDVRMTTDELEWRMAKLVIEGFDLARHEPAPVMFPGNRAREARAIAALKLRRFEETGLAFGSAAGDGTRVSVASIVVEGVDKGRIGTLKVAGTEIRNPGSTKPDLSIDEMSVSGVDLGLPIGQLTSVSWQPGMPVGRIWTERLSISGFGGEAMARYGVALERIVVETKRESDRVARAQSRVEGLTFRPSGRSREGMQMTAALMSIGLREVKVEFDCAGIEDRTKGELEIGPCAIAGPGLARMEFGAKVIGADETFWRALDDGDIGLFLATKAALGSALLVVRDDSLLDRVLTLYANASNQQRATARAEIAREVRRYQPTGVLITESLTKFADTLARFVERGGTLTVTAKPDPPLDIERIGYLASPGPDIVDVLGLSATLAR